MEYSAFFCRAVMSYPEELIFLFPALPYLPKNHVNNFLNNPLVRSFSNMIVENRKHWLSSFYLPDSFLKRQSNELYLSFPDSYKLKEQYNYALIEHEPEINNISDHALLPLVKAYKELDCLKQKESDIQGRESVGIFLDDINQVEEEIKLTNNKIKQLRRKLCLSELGHSIKIKEIHSICAQHPIINQIKHQLYGYDHEQIRLTIYNHFLNHIKQSMPFMSPFDLESEHTNLANAFVDGIFNDDQTAYNKAATSYLKIVDQKVQKELNKYKYIDVSLYPKAIAHLFSEFIQGLTGKTDQIAQAYQFIQYSGFGSQSDFFIFDVYSALRNHNKVSELKAILYGILKPFYPILREYRQIGLFENNDLWKIIRTTMPLLIITATFVSITAILTPLALPEIAFITLLIPSLFLGLGIASTYCKFKEGLYQSFRQHYYGGQYNLPEFQINERMQAIFGKSADVVQKFYISALQQCQLIEENFVSISENKGLTIADKEQRIENIQRLHLLLKEWRDIHENLTLTKEELLVTVGRKFNQEINKKFVRLNSKIPYEENVWKKYTKNFKSQAQLTPSNVPLVSNNVPLVSNIGMFQNEKKAIITESKAFAPVINESLKIRQINS